MISTAKFSPCEKYRYLLTRTWNRDGPTCLFVMLNPSSADEHNNDPTIGRCINYAMRWGFGRLEVVNLFAYRTPSPKALLLAHNPIGRINDWQISVAAKKASRIILAWGNHGVHQQRAKAVMELLSPFSYKLRYFRITAKGQPIHPLYQAGNATLNAA